MSARDRIIRAVVGLAGVAAFAIAAHGALAPFTARLSSRPDEVAHCGSRLFPRDVYVCEVELGLLSGPRNEIALGFAIGSFLAVLSIAYRRPCRWVSATAAAIVIAVAFVSYSSHRLVV